MRRPGLSLLVVSASIVVCAPPVTAEPAGTGYTCAFRGGTTRTYAKGVFRAKAVKPLMLEIADIDLDGQRAAIVQDGKKGPLRAMRAINASHFIEAVTEGYLNFTTIYDFDAKRGAHPAVHSRHFGLFGEPVVAQYTGFCKPR